MQNTLHRAAPSTLYAALLLAGAVSCAAPGQSANLPAALLPTALTTLNCSTGESATWDEVIAATLAADVILLAELHGHPVGLPYHALVLERSLQLDPDAALCLEFITRDWQYLLDAWADGIVDGAAVQETLDTAPGSTAAPHLPLIELAHENGVRVLAANSPRIYTRAAKAKGYEALAVLSTAQQRLFHVPEVMPTGPYRDGFFEMMRGFDSNHGAVDNSGGQDVAVSSEPTPELIAKFRSQSLWDGTMSDTVLSALDAGAGRVFLAVGSYHANNDGGIVQILRNRRPDAKVVVISFKAEHAPDKPLPNLDFEGFATFLTFAGPFPEAD
ncbi:MAG: putative iron-regulated protein [Bacteroidia bacterium]|jgi:uncharacterized iron-regulated protein